MTTHEGMSLTDKSVQHVKLSTSLFTVHHCNIYGIITLIHLFPQTRPLADHRPAGAPLSWMDGLVAC